MCAIYSLTNTLAPNSVKVSTPAKLEASLPLTSSMRCSAREVGQLELTRLRSCPEGCTASLGQGVGGMVKDVFQLCRSSEGCGSPLSQGMRGQIGLM